MAVTDVILAQAEQFLVAAIKANYTSNTGDELDLRAGTPQYDLLVRAQLPVVAQIIDLINTTARKTTLLAVSELTDAELAAIGARYFLTRSAGTRASGTVVIKFKDRQAVTLRTNDVFTQNELSYFPTKDVNVAAADLIEDPVLGYFYTRVQLQAGAVGADYGAAVGTVFTCDALAGNDGLIEIVAAAPMIGGQGQESAAAFAERIRTAPVVANMVNRLSVDRVLYQEFPGVITRLLVVGHQEPEMLRDRIQIVDPVAGDITVAIGGHVDIYVKTPIVRDTVAIPVVAGQGSVDLSEYRAVLKVHDVRVKDNPDLRPYFDLAGSTPALRFSALDPVRLEIDPGLPAATLLVDISYAPDVVRIHDYVNSYSNRIVSANTLVRYFHPVWLAGTVYAQGLTAAQKNEAIANIQIYLDNLRAGESIAVSQVTAAIYQAGATNVIQDYDLFGQILYGDNTLVNFSSPYVLSFQDDPIKGFSNRTACFLHEAITIEALI